MFIYETKDKYHYEGLHTLASYTLGCVLAENYIEKDNKHNFHTPREFHTFLVLSFTKLCSLDYSYDKETIFKKGYISALPFSDKEKNELILFLKKENPDSLLIFSKLPLIKLYPSLRELNKFKNLRSDEQFESLEKCYEVVDQLFRTSLSSVKDHECSNDEIEKNNKNKFDKSNYALL